MALQSPVKYDLKCESLSKNRNSNASLFNFEHNDQVNCTSEGLCSHLAVILAEVINAADRART